MEVTKPTTQSYHPLKPHSKPKTSLTKRPKVYVFDPFAVISVSDADGAVTDGNGDILPCKIGKTVTIIKKVLQIKTSAMCLVLK